ncbi:MAG: hypothetical protein AMXMBFR33_33540 [Candidatus Xenobia bacterium]|jgi:hypothetical protein
MRTLILLLALSCLAVAAGPGEWRAKGKLTGVPAEARPVAFSLNGKLLHCRGQIFGYVGMGEARGVRLKLRLKNVSRQKVRYALHGAVLDKRGELLGADGVQEIVGLEPGKDALVQFDLAIPRAEQKRVAAYQAVLFERTP